MIILLYELALILFFLIYLPGALLRRRLPHAGWSMRLGRYPKEVLVALAGKPSIWVHAVSVGEVIASQPLVETLLQLEPATPLVLSTVTPGGYEVAAKRFGSRVTRIFFPLDFRGCVRSALDKLKPKILILMESELWPTVIREAKQRSIPVAVVNGRISARTFERSWRVRSWMRPMLHSVDQFLMQSREDADRLIELGALAQRIQVTGSLKWDASIGARPSDESLKQLSEHLGIQPGQTILIGGSTHRGEEAQLLKAFQVVLKSNSRARLILAPRHLERLDEVEALIRSSGLSSARFSQTNLPAQWQVGLVDVFGQLALYYGLASVVFIGGSLIAHGGQNPLEATSLGKPVVFGRSMHNFSVIAHQLLALHAARQVGSPEELISTIEELVSKPEASAAMGKQAKAVTENFRGATERTVSALKPLLKPGREWPRGYG